MYRNHASHEDAAAPVTPKEHSFASRALVALAFGTVGGKLGYIGNLADINKYAGKGLSLGEKWKAITSGEFMERVSEAFHSNRARGKGVIKSAYNVAKYSSVTFISGLAVGAVIGWVRGGLIADYKDILKHPWRSTKIIFGVEEPPEAKTASADKQTAHAERADGKSWVDVVAQERALPADIAR